MHFNIPVTEEKTDKFGGRYVVYNIYLEGLLLCKVRYSDMHKWNEELRRVFKDCVPRFPPKYFLAMTEKMQDQRRHLLEQYLQKVAEISSIATSGIFCSFFRKMQQETFRIPERSVVQDVILPDGRKIGVEIRISDTAHTLMEIVSDKMGLPRDLMGYFGLFLVQVKGNETLSVVKKLVPFELPRLTLESLEGGPSAIMVRKSAEEPPFCVYGAGGQEAALLDRWENLLFSAAYGYRPYSYLDTSVDAEVLQSSCGLSLLCAQAAADLERGWSLPTEEQRGTLGALLEAGRKREFLQAAQRVRYYGHIQLDPCTCDHPEPSCPAAVWVGHPGLHCCITLPGNQTREEHFEINQMKSWCVSMLSRSSQDDAMGLSLSFEYTFDEAWKSITLHTKQAEPDSAGSLRKLEGLVEAVGPPCSFAAGLGQPGTEEACCRGGRQPLSLLHELAAIAAFLLSKLMLLALKEQQAKVTEDLTDVTDPPNVRRKKSIFKNMKVSEEEAIKSKRTAPK
ncbi:SNX31 protein, partial [Atractosteus spatula]|nr:SNX31 protein [Atractosteus spatula]